MAVDGKDPRTGLAAEMDTIAGSGRKAKNPQVSTYNRLGLSVENKRVDAGRDGRTWVARPNS